MALPSPALALRGANLAESAGLEELAKSLQAETAAAGAEENLERKYPLWNIFHGQGVTDKAELEKRLKKIAALNAQFFGPVDGKITVSAIDQEPSLAKKRQMLLQFEKDWDSRGMLNSLLYLSQIFYMYREINAFEDAKRFYETYAGRDALFGQDDAVYADYLLAQNRLGLDNRSTLMAEANRRLEKLEKNRRGKDPDQDKLTQTLRSEIYIGLGTNYKNIYAAAKDFLTLLLQVRARLQNNGGQPQETDVDLAWYALRNYLNYSPQDSISTITSRDGVQRTLSNRSRLSGLIESVRRRVARVETMELETARQFYLKAYEADLTYYPGINVVRTLIYQGNVSAARRFARQVKIAAQQADLLKSFWEQATLLEIALLEVNQEDTARHLYGILHSTQNPAEFYSLIEHLRRWAWLSETPMAQRQTLLAAADLLGSFVSDGTILDDSKLHARLERLLVDPEYSKKPGFRILARELLKYSEQEEQNQGSLERMVEKAGYRMGLFRRASTLPNNARRGGVVPDIRRDLVDRTLARGIAQQLGLVGNLDMDEISDIINGFIERQALLRNPQTQTRDLEDVKSPRHDWVIDRYVKNLFEMTGVRESRMSSVSLMQSLGLGVGIDCRGTNFSKEAIADEAFSFELDKRKRIALQYFLANDFVAYDKQLDETERLLKQRPELLVFEVMIRGKIKLRRDSDGKPQIYEIEKDPEGFFIFDAQAQDVERHALVIEIVRDRHGKIQSLILRDAWYHGGDGKTYRFKRLEISRKDLEDYFLGKPEQERGFLARKAVVVSDRASGRRFDMDVLLKPLSYSYQRHTPAPRRLPADFSAFAAGPVRPMTLDFFALPGNDQFRQKQQQLMKRVIEPIVGTPYLWAGAEEKELFSQSAAGRFDHVQKLLVDALIQLRGLEGSPFKIQLDSELVARLKKTGDARLNQEIIFSERLTLEPVISTILLHLLPNVLDALGRRWGAKADEQGQVRLRVGMRGQMLWLELTDNGDGFRPEVLQAIQGNFPLPKDQGSKKSTFGQKRLGISQVRSIAKAFNGSLNVQNRTDTNGAIVKVELKIEPELAQRFLREAAISLSTFTTNDLALAKRITEEIQLQLQSGKQVELVFKSRPNLTAFYSDPVQITIAPASEDPEWEVRKHLNRAGATVGSWLLKKKKSTAISPDTIRMEFDLTGITAGVEERLKPDKVHILFVEDRDDIRRMLQAVFVGSEGHPGIAVAAGIKPENIHIVSAVQEAVDIIARVKPAYVQTDMNLGEARTGADIARFAKEQGGPQTYVTLLAALEPDQSVPLDVDVPIRKPASLKDLKDAFNNFVRDRLEPAAGAEESTADKVSLGTFEATDLSHAIADAVRQRIDAVARQPGENLTGPIIVILSNESTALIQPAQAHLDLIQRSPPIWETVIQQALDEVRMDVASGNWALSVNLQVITRPGQHLELVFRLRPASAGAEEKLEAAVAASKDVSFTEPYSGLEEGLLPVFYARETFGALGIAAMAGPFLVMVSSVDERKAVEDLLAGMAVSPERYDIWTVPEGKISRALGQARRQMSERFVVYPVNPERPHWLKELMAVLEEFGVLSIGDLPAAIQATQDYFKFV